MKKLTLAAAALAASLMGIGAAQAQVEIIARVAPPAQRYEVVPAPRTGYVWQQGHWQWRTNQYVWVPGTWVTARSGYAYVQPHWVQRNGQWVYAAGNWRKGPNGDRDRDGIANRYDRDRDGDGIPNRYDNNGRRGQQHSQLGPYGDLDRDGVHNRNDWDIDGDRVSNRRDRYPYDYRRS